MRASALAALRGAEPGVASVSDELLLENSAPSKQPRADGANRYTEDVGRSFIGLVLEIHEHYGRLERLVQLAKSPA